MSELCGTADDCPPTDIRGQSLMRQLGGDVLVKTFYLTLNMTILNFRFNFCLVVVDWLTLSMNLLTTDMGNGGLPS